MTRTYADGIEDAARVDSALVEKLARIIDPLCWWDKDRTFPMWDGECSRGREIACQKARDILAIRTLSPSPSGIEDAREALTSVALLAVVDAVRDYLPPDGIGAQECLSRIIGAVDNQEINPIIRELEHDRS